MTNKGDVRIQGNAIAESNVSDMLNKSFNPLSKLQNLIGWEQFELLMRECNPPQSIVKMPPAIKTVATSK